MPFGIQPIHLVVVAIVALIIFGPRRLPEIGRGIGRALNEFRQGAQEMTQSFQQEVTKPTAAAASPAAPAAATTSAAPAADNATATDTQKVFCTNCGSPNAPDARFCNRCGTAMPAA